MELSKMSKNAQTHYSTLQAITHGLYISRFSKNFFVRSSLLQHEFLENLRV